MTREEFEAIRKKLGYDLSGLTSEEYEYVNYVYTFHPSISEVEGKKQIVDLVGTFGMQIIYDMMPTARWAEQQEKELRELEAQVEKAAENLEKKKREFAEARKKYEREPHMSAEM